MLTTTDAPERGVIEGVRSMLAQAKCPPSEVGLVVHGTTLATNALIERKGARTALVTTAGFRDSLEIAWEHRFEQYDIYMERPDPLVSRDLRFGVPERVAADGAVLLPLDEQAVRQVATELRRHKIEAVAVCFLHSFTNEAHERRAGAILAEELPGVAISLSCEVCPEIREYERTSTTIANAYVLPRMAGYLGELEANLRKEGIAGPLLLMMSSGGITTVETARRYPVRLVEIRPGRRRHPRADRGGRERLREGRRLRHGRHDGQAHPARRSRTAALAPVRGRARLPLRAGQRPAGAHSRDRAGRDRRRRRLDRPHRCAGPHPGRPRFRRQRARPRLLRPRRHRAHGDRCRHGAWAASIPSASPAAPSRFTATRPRRRCSRWPVRSTPTPQGAAAGVAEIVDETMASAARVHAVENGKDTAERTLIAFGGAAPLHAARLARKLGMKKIVVPVGAGVGSAFGFLRAPIAYEVVRTRHLRLDLFDAKTVNGLFAAMREEAEAVVRLAAPDEKLVETRLAFMRYRGQGHEIAVPLPNQALDVDAARDLRRRFEATYETVFGRIIPKLEVEALTWTLSLATDRPLPKPAAEAKAAAAPKASGHRERARSGLGPAREGRPPRTHVA